MSADPAVPRQVGDALARWIDDRDAASWDPYDALTSPLLRPLVRLPVAARLAMQVVKRSPVNLRPWLGIRPALLTQSLAALSSAWVMRERLGRAGARERARDYLDRLRDRRLAGVPGSAWGMDLPYISRFVQATPSTPNLFQSVNAAAAFADAFAAWGDPADLDVALGFATFLQGGLGRLEESADAIAWRYYPGHDACVYNVNALAGALLLRLGRAAQRDDLAALGLRTLRFVVQGQSPDGSWHYARGREGRWVDGFHSGYVLESLARAEQLANEPWVEEALAKGVAHYLRTLFTADHLPRYTTRSTMPLEVQNCAQAIQTLAVLAQRDRSLLPRARATADAVLRALFRWTRTGGGEPSGYFVLSRGRWWTNGLAAVRWGQAPMLLAFAHLEVAESQEPALDEGRLGHG